MADNRLPDGTFSVNMSLLKTKLQCHDYEALSESERETLVILAELRSGPTPSTASSFRAYFCDECENLHISLLTEDGQTYTEMVITIGQLGKLNEMFISHLLRSQR